MDQITQAVDQAKGDPSELLRSSPLSGSFEVHSVRGSPNYKRGAVHLNRHNWRIALRMSLLRTQLNHA